MTAITLRPYQASLIDQVRDEFRVSRRVMLQAGTGLGKTVMAGWIVRTTAERGKRAMFLAHRRELINQASGKLDELGVPHGVIAGAGGVPPMHVHVGSVQTVARRIARITPPDLIIFDEAHHAAAAQYRAIADAWPDARILGISATPQRLDGKGLDEVFDSLICGPTITEMMEAGFLSRVQHLAPPNSLDMTGVRTMAGDYAAGDLRQAVERSTITGDAVAHYQRHALGLPAVAFCVSVDHAEVMAQAFRDAGIASVSVDGSLPPKEREARILGLATGQVKVLTSCDLISEGLDIPSIVAVLLLRPTQSLTIYMQSIGRALRPAPGKSHAIVLDHVGNIHRHGPVDMPREWSLGGRKRKDRDAPQVRVCETCFRAFAPSECASVAADCRNDLCGMAAMISAAAAGREEPETVSGDLEIYTPPPPPPWVPQDIDIRNAKGRDWYRLLRAADDEAKLRDIARFRGYRLGWVHKVMAERNQVRRHAPAGQTGAAA